jgi:selenocysteine lyase/cysteine desulfurase
MKLDIEFIRTQFPAFSEPSLDGWAFFENAGGSYACKQVIKRLTDYYTKTKVQPYYSYETSKKAGEKMDDSYVRLAAYLNVHEEEIHFGPSTTQNIYVLANAMRPMWKKGDEIIVSCQDHEANAGAWRRLADNGLTIKEWHVNPKTGHLNIEDLQNLISRKTKMIAFPHCSNLIAEINPVKEIVSIARKNGILTVVDGVAFAPHGFPNLTELDVDVYLFSLYKTWGPHQGLMYIKKDLMSKLKNQSHFFKDGITRSMLVPAGPDHAQVAAAGGIAEYFDTVYQHHFDEIVAPAVKMKRLNQLFHKHEKDLMSKLLDFLKSRNDVRIIGPDNPDLRAPTISILPLKKEIKDITSVLVDQKCMTGSGHFYAVRPIEEMQINIHTGVLRMSFIHYTTMHEIEQLIGALKIALN